MNFVKFLLITLTFVATTSITLESAKREMSLDGSKDEKSEVKDSEEKTEGKDLITITSRDEKKAIQLPLACFNQSALFRLTVGDNKDASPTEIAQNILAPRIILSHAALTALQQMLVFIQDRLDAALLSSRSMALQLAHDIDRFNFTDDNLFDIINLTNYLDAKILFTACLIHLAKNPRPTLESLRLQADLAQFIAYERDLSTLSTKLAKEHCFEFESVEKSIQLFTSNITNPDFDFANHYLMLPSEIDEKSVRPQVLTALTQKAHACVDEKISDQKLKNAFKALPENWFKMKIREVYHAKNGRNIDDVNIAAVIAQINRADGNINLYNMNLTIPLQGIMDILIVCNNVTPIRVLNLHNNQLHGTIPASIGKLIKLGELNLQNNQLSGTIPASISNLSNLKWLNLHNNQFHGTIPASIDKLIKLRELNLQDNQLSNTEIPTSLYAQLELERLGVGWSAGFQRAVPSNSSGSSASSQSTSRWRSFMSYLTKR